MLETFLQHGLLSFGGYAFFDDADRYLVQAVTTGRRSRFFWTGVVGAERVDGVSRGRCSMEGEVAPLYNVAFGGRVGNRGGDGAPAAVLPYARAHVPGTRYTLYLAVEHRLQRERHATLVALGTAF